MSSQLAMDGATPEETGEAAPTSVPSPVLRVDAWLVGAICVLLSLGVVLVYSSSSVHAFRTYGEASFFLNRQLIGVGLGLVLLLGALRVPTASLARRAPLILTVATVLCALVLIPGLGRVAGGARRWLELGGFRFQPSELAKLAIVVVMAAMLAARERKAPERRVSLLVPLLLVQIPVALILAEPDLGTAVEANLIVGAMIFAAGLRYRTLLLMGLGALPLLYHLIVGTPFRLRRLLGYIDPWAYRSTVGYQVTEALMSIGSGGLSGVGLGDSKHKLFFLPEAHTDFIFAILGEELGFIGIVVVLAAFGVIVWRGSRIALAAQGKFERYLAFGLTLLVGIPAVLNVCVATGLLPTKGLPLPLMSYGRSNLVMTLLTLGILLRIDLQNRRLAEESGG